MGLEFNVMFHRKPLSTYLYTIYKAYMQIFNFIEKYMWVGRNKRLFYE